MRVHDALTVHVVCRPRAASTVDSLHRQADSRRDSSIVHMLEYSTVDDGHARHRHRAAPLYRVQGCLQTRAPMALPSTAMQPAPSARSMPALTGATLDCVDRGHAASPCLQGAGGYLRPSAAPRWAPALGATVASPSRQSAACTLCRRLPTALGASLRTGSVDRGLQTRSALWRGLSAGVCSPVSAVSGRRG